MLSQPKHKLSQEALGRASIFRTFQKPGRSLLSKYGITWHIKEGNIVVHPLSERDIRTTSIDVHLGPWFFREQRTGGAQTIVNPFDEAHVKRYWGPPQFAIQAGDWMNEHGSLANIRPQDRLIVVGGSETILTHTGEFAGGRVCVTTEMRARSTMGRIGMTVCKCAGWGDIGYINRWTMEMTNHGGAAIILVVGMRVAQLIFYEVDPVPQETYAGSNGKYQTSDELEKIIADWSPWNMLPKMYKDYETTEGFKRMEANDAKLLASTMPIRRKGRTRKADSQSDAASRKNMPSPRGSGNRKR